MAGIAAFVRGWFREPPPTFELRSASARWGQAKPRQARHTLRVTEVIRETPSTCTTRTMHGSVCVDWDGDGIPDDWEIKYGLNTSADDSGLDPDGDGLTNSQEYYGNTDPLRLDTDGDGVRDSQEYYGSVSESLMRGVEVIASDANGMTLELRTESFESVVVDVGGVSYHRLRVPEYLLGIRM